MSHPYVPADLDLEGFRPISLDAATILGVFFVAWGVVLLTLIPYLRYGAKLSLSDTLVCTWLVISGLTHIFTEGPVVWNAHFFSDPPGNFMNELWKEYGKADSRYLTRDACTIGIEAITVFAEGPVCLLLVLAFIWQRPWRHVVTVVTVTGELYGTVLYFLTSFFEEFEYQRKEPLYFWFYFVTMNSIWIVFPFLVIVQMLKEVSQAVTVASKHNSKKLK